jgi:hypothetical protein
MREKRSDDAIQGCRTMPRIGSPSRLAMPQRLDDQETSCPWA